MDFMNCHGHTDASNYNNRDSIIKTEQMIDIAIELDHKGVAITDHAVLSNHVKALNYLKKLKEKDESLKDFKLALGCEIYLVNKDEIDLAREKNERTKFYHLVVLAKNETGYRQLTKISSKGWKNSFYYRAMERTPVYKTDLTNIVNENKGNLVVTSACLGSEFATYVLSYLDAKKLNLQKRMNEYQNKINNYLIYMKELFGDDYYIELQPSYGDEQIEYNTFALEIGRYYGIKCIVATDAHYQRPEYRNTHAEFLKSQNAERETDSFYQSTYMMSVEEIKEYFEYLDEDTFNNLIENTNEIRNKIEDFDLYKPTQEPNATIKYDESYEGYFKNVKSLSLNYPYIYKYLTSEHLIDRIILQQIEMGMERLNQEYNVINLTRLNKELESMWLVSEGLGERLSSYYVLTKEIVDLIWQVSIVGISRGSAGAYYICYILGITQINPIQYDLPEWRHIDSSKIELADIDVDSESAQRTNILELVKQKYGYDKVLTIATFKTEGSASAIQTICRGMGIDINDAKYLSSLIPRDGMDVKSINYCLENYSYDKKCKLFIDELKKFDDKYEGFIENIQRIEGLICGRSSHASGVYIFKETYDQVNAMMKTPSGLPITQYNMLDSDYQSGLKLDFLTISSLDRIRKTMDLLLKDGEIEWKGSLRDTYNEYIHPDKIDLKNEKMFKMLREGKVQDAFQYDSVSGADAIAKIQPNTFQELMDGNALMRLNPKNVELPIIRYVRHKKDINIWYNEMRAAGLTNEEMEVLKTHLLKSYGVAPTQESIMRLSMDKNISGFDLIKANKLRKAVAKAYAKHMVEDVRLLMLSEGEKLGNRKQFIEYVWENFIVPQLKYSFSEPHLAGYTLILMQELNLALKYPTLYWNVACLSVSAGNISEEVNKGADYGAIAKAIGKMDKGFVLPPDINKAKMEFIPIRDLNKAMYSINAVNGIGEDVAREIINNRPYTNFEDFLNKCVKTKLVSKSKVFNLIKAGCFDSMQPDRVELMKQYVIYSTEQKSKLTTANIPKILEYNLLPDELKHLGDLFKLRKEIFKKENLVETINKTTGLYDCSKVANNLIMETFYEYFEGAMEVGSNGSMCYNNKKFDKVYKKILEPLVLWLNSEELLDRFNNHLRGLNWQKNCSGTKESWEIESICYYTDKHILDYMKLEQFYNIKSFLELPKIPVVTETYKRKGREYENYKLDIISGTVIDKDKNKSIVTISTQTGVVDIKLDKGRFSYYDRTTDYDESWFKRGTVLMIVGYRRDEVFYPKTYSNSIYSHSFMRVRGYIAPHIHIDLERLDIE